MVRRDPERPRRAEHNNRLGTAPGRVRARFAASQNSATPIADAAAHKSRPTVTLTTPTCTSVLITNGATRPRAPVMKFQPLITEARSPSVVSSLISEAIPTSIDELLTPIAIAENHRRATVGAIA